MAASDGAPPGYADGSVRAADAEDGRLALARFLWLVFAALAASLDQVALRQLSAYLLPGSSPSAELAQGLLLLGLVAGALAARRARAGFRALAVALSLAALLLAASGTLWFFAMSNGALFRALSWALAPALGLSAGVACFALFSALGRAARGLDVLGYFLRPAAVCVVVPGLVGYAALGAQLGLLRSAAALALVLAALALYVPVLAAFLRGRPMNGRGLLHALGAVACVCALGAYAFAERALPRAVLGVFPGDIVWRSARTNELTLVSQQQSFELYYERELRLTSADATRYAEALVHPALARAPRRARVLLLGLASGLAEREILRYPDVVQLTSLSADLALARLARENPLFCRLSAGALGAGRLRLLEREPLPWLEQSREEFDVIVLDMPDPSGYLAGKYYTHYFYRRLYEHLSADGVLVTQATSSSSSPAALASIAHTLAGAGFAAQVYSAALPLLGEWAFVLGARGALVAPARLSADALRVLDQTRYVDRAGLALLFENPPELSPGAEDNTLAHQPVVELLGEERRIRGY